MKDVINIKEELGKCVREGQRMYGKCYREETRSGAPEEDTKSPTERTANIQSGARQTYENFNRELARKYMRERTFEGAACNEQAIRLSLPLIADRLF